MASEEIKVKVNNYGPGRSLVLVYVDPMTRKKVARSVYGVPGTVYTIIRLVLCSGRFLPPDHAAKFHSPASISHATRNPIRLLPSGGEPTRAAERQSAGRFQYDPPRITRSRPDAGPAGSSAADGRE